MKVYTVSDLHVDYRQNMDWVLSLDAAAFRRDILVLAGDVSHVLDELRRVLASLAEKFRAVHFIPGNHELWVEDGRFDCSLEKFHAVQSLCRELGIHTGTCHYPGLSIVPLYGWYDFSFAEPERHLLRAWRDFRACRWPAELDGSGAVNAFFLDMNREQLSVKNTTVISYSHFLPRIDVMPKSIPGQRRKVYPVLGSKALGEQVRRLRPDIHIYGHSHVNRSIELDNIHYVNNAFAYPGENVIARKALYCVLEQPAMQLENQTG